MGSDRCQDSYLWIQKTTIKIWTTPKVVKEKKICVGEDFWHFYWALQSGWHWKLEKLTQIKEKWRALFERYKAIVDNRKKTGGGRESFEFFEIMDEFLGCPDKVRPKFVKQTQLLENKNNGESENLDKEEAPKDLEVVENCKNTFAWHLFYLGKSLFAWNRWNYGKLKPKCDVPRQNLP